LICFYIYYDNYLTILITVYVYIGLLDENYCKSYYIYCYLCFNL